MLSTVEEIVEAITKMRDDAESRAKSHIARDEPGRHIEANIMKNEMNLLLDSIDVTRGKSSD